MILKSMSDTDGWPEAGSFNSFAHSCRINLILQTLPRLKMLRGPQDSVPVVFFFFLSGKIYCLTACMTDSFLILYLFIYYFTAVEIDKCFPLS